MYVRSREGDLFITNEIVHTQTLNMFVSVRLKITSLIVVNGSMGSEA